MNIQRHVRTASGQITSRRRLLVNMGIFASGAGVIASSLTASPAIAQRQKLSPADIGYQSRPNGSQRCDQCVNLNMYNVLLQRVLKRIE